MHGLQSTEYREGTTFNSLELNLPVLSVFKLQHAITIPAVITLNTTFFPNKKFHDIDAELLVSYVSLINAIRVNSSPGHLLVHKDGAADLPEYSYHFRLDQPKQSKEVILISHDL